MIKILLYGWPFLLAIVGLYLFNLKRKIKSDILNKEIDQSIKEVLDVKKDEQARSTDSISNVDQRLSEFTRKE